MNVIRTVISYSIWEFQPPDGVYLVDAPATPGFGEEPIKTTYWAMYRGSERVLWQLNDCEARTAHDLYEEHNTPPRLEMGLLKGEL